MNKQTWLPILFAAMIAMPLAAAENGPESAATNSAERAARQTKTVAASPVLAFALGTSTRGLVERTSAVAGGGVLLDLDGRFQSAMVGVVGPDGHIAVRCADRPSADSKKEVRHANR